MLLDKKFRRAATAALIASIAAHANAAAAEDTLKVGVAMAQTEFMAVFDQPFALGFALAADEINAKGGIGGKIKIEIESQDTRSEASQTLLITQEMVDKGVDVLVMSGGNADGLAAGPVAQAAGTLVIHGAGSNPSIAPIVGDHFKAVQFADNLSAAAVATYAREDLDLKTAWLLISPDDPYTNNTPLYFAERFKALGGEIVGQGTYSLFQQEFGNIVQQIRALPNEPDIIFTTAFEPDFPIFLKQLRAAGVKSRVMATDGIDSPTIYGMGDIANGVVLVTPRPQDTSKLENLKKLYAESQGADAFLDNFAILGYTAAWIAQ